MRQEIRVGDLDFPWLTAADKVSVAHIVPTPFLKSERAVTILVNCGMEGCQLLQSLHAQTSCDLWVLEIDLIERLAKGINFALKLVFY